MTPLDYVTAGEAALAAVALAFRGNMLKPEAKGWTTSRTASLVIMGLSVVFACLALDIARRGGATPREAIMCTALALSSVGMLVHLAMQHKGPEAAK